MFCNGFEFSVLVRGKSIREYVHNGKTYIEGRTDSGYQLKISNNTSTDAEVIFSVDGLDVIDGEPASVKKSGYIVPAYRSVTIDGWRLNDKEIAAFEFGSTSSSYAASQGKPRNIGVIGAAIFLRKPEYYWHNYNTNLSANVTFDSSPSRGAIPKSVTFSSAAPVSSTNSIGGSSMNISNTTTPGLGTRFGERQNSAVTHVDFKRATDHPGTIFEIHYNNRQGLEELGIPVSQPLSEDTARRETARAFEDIDKGCKPPVGWQG